MHVFIDTNILLNFFHFSKDELDALQNVFASHEHGSAKVHLTQQVRDEFKRNRENRIKDALKRFKENRFATQLPSFMKAYEEYDEIRKLSVELQKKQKDILDKANQAISSKSLLADRLIGEIFGNSKIIETTDNFYCSAKMRMELGNPPGKNNSIGDAVNWVVLLSSVPDNKDIHIVSEDGDFYSALDEKAPHPFLAEEWSQKKNSRLFVYRTLDEFIKEHFDGVAFSFDKDKEALIDDLKYSSSFSETHGLIAKLDEYSYFSLKEVEEILKYAINNNQFGWIIDDDDVLSFLNRVAVPHMASISVSEQKQLLQHVIDKQRECGKNSEELE